MNAWNDLSRRRPEDIESFIHELEALSESEIKRWWDMKFMRRKQEVVVILEKMGDKLDSYPRCKSILVLNGK